MVGYQGHIIPIIIAVWLMSVIEKKLHKVVPEVLDLFVTPLVSVFVTGYLTLAAIGPVFVWAENAILELYPVASDTSSGIGKSDNGRSVCTDRSDRNPSDVCSD